MLSLVDRKEQWVNEQEEKLRKQAIKKEGGGPGLVKMSESSRQEMLEGLMKSLEITTAEVNRLPITMKTQALQRKRKELDEKLTFLDESIEKLNKAQPIWIAATSPDEEVCDEEQVELTQLESPRYTSKYNVSQESEGDAVDRLLLGKRRS